MSRRPLDGLRVVVTRAAHQSGELAAAFEAAGAEVALLPLLEILPPEDVGPLERAAASIAGCDWLAFTSANAVGPFLGRVPAGAALPPVAAVGPATAVALKASGVEPRLVAGKSRAAGLAEALIPHLSPGARVLFPRADDARGELADRLAAAGAEVVAVVAYRKRLPRQAAAIAGRLFAAAPLGWVTFSSPRVVRHFVELLGDAWERRRGELRAVSVGPVTSRELRRRGVEPAAEAVRPGAGAMVRAVVEARTP